MNKYRFLREMESYKTVKELASDLQNLMLKYGKVRECCGKDSVLREMDPSVINDLPISTVIKNVDMLYKTCNLSKGLDEKVIGKLHKLLTAIDGGYKDSFEDWKQLFFVEGEENQMRISQMSLLAKTYMVMLRPEKFTLSTDSICELCCSLLPLESDRRNCWASGKNRYIRHSEEKFPVSSVDFDDPNSNGSGDLSFYMQNSIGYFRQISSGREVLRRELDDMCKAYNEAVRDREDVLFVTPMFVVDFLMSSPFKGPVCNNVMARLLTMLLLAKGGYDIYKYISYELVFEHLKKDHAVDLSGSAYFSHAFFGVFANGRNYMPFIDYSLNHLILAYEYLFYRLLPLGGRDRKAKCIKALFKNEHVRLTKSDIHDLCYEISVPTIESVLGKLSDVKKKDRFLNQVGKGRTTSYELHVRSKDGDDDAADEADDKDGRADK
ncbi:hypothetical protein IJT93_08340 [bacterium]|nr:hypothetical protein [bacterium]